MKNFMIDLETMGTRSNSAIVSIGICHFDANEILSTFYTPVSLQSCLDDGLVEVESTKIWWAAQAPEARTAWDVPDAPSMSDALKAMDTWLRSMAKPSEIVPWSMGADFDLVLLKSAYEALSADLPWKYYNNSCFRTIKNMFKVEDEPRTGTYHHALDDAVTQAKHLQRILKLYHFNLK